MRRALLATLLVLSAIAAPAQAAAPDPWLAQNAQCLVNDALIVGCLDVEHFGDAWDIAFSPDGKQAYSISQGGRSLITFDRDTGTGVLTRRPGTPGCLQDLANSYPNCTRIPALNGPQDIEVSADGKNVYFVSVGGGVRTLSRDTTTGTVSDVAGGCGYVDASEGCFVVRGLRNPRSLVLSPDGKNVYVTAISGAVGIFDRDATTGLLTQKAGTAGCVNTNVDDGVCTSGRSLGDTRKPAISSDGRSFYMGAGAGVAVFDRNTTTGALTQKAGIAGCIGHLVGCTQEPRLAGTTFTVAVAPDDGQVYATSRPGSGTGGRVVALARAADGSLSLLGCIGQTAELDCVDGRNLQSPRHLTISPDGEAIVVGAESGAGGVALLSRDPQTGALTQPAGIRGCITATGSATTDAAGTNAAGSCLTRAGIANTEHTTFFDEQSFFVATSSTSSINGFRRDFDPICDDTTATVPFNQTVPVDLPCRDRNGDALTLSITAAPLKGILGPVDQANDRVFYDPFDNVTGSDGFEFRASGGGQQSALALASLTILPKPPVDEDGDGFSPPADCNDAVAAIRPGAVDTPGNGVDEDCSGADTPAPAVQAPAAVVAPPKRINAPVSFAWRYFRAYTSVVSLSVAGVPAGGTVEVRCRGRGCPFKVKRTTHAAATVKVNLAKLFNFKKKKRKVVSKLRLRAKLEIRITAPGAVGKSVTFTVQPKKAPRFVVTCLTPGTSASVACGD